MGFLSSRIELNNTIKTLEAEVESLKTDISAKSKQITELNKKITTLSQKNAEYEKKYINTNLECEFCYTTLQDGFVFCPKCGKKIEVKHSIPAATNTNYFVTESDGDSCVITRYNGFDEKHIIIPSQINKKKVIGIADEVFSNCKNIEEVVFENGCEYIGNKAFYHCGQLKKIRLPKTIKEIGEDAFSGSAIKEFVLPPNVRALGWGVFSYCKELKDVVISENLSVIPPFAFSNSGIEKIDIPNNITVIGMNAFANTLLKEIELPPDLQTIKINAFRDCSSIQKITIHSNATTIENILYYTPATIYCAAGSEAQKYAREHGLKMVQIDSVPKPAKRENLVSTILITFVDCVLNSRSGISQAYFPTWVKNIIGGYNISHWHWQSGKSNWGMQIYSTKPYTLSEAQEIKKKIENHSQNLSVRIELKTFRE